MPAQLIGAHMPTGKGLGQAIREAHKIGCTAVQVFTSSPQMWRASTATPEKIADFQKAKTETGIDVVVSHDSYLVNLCAVNPEIHVKSLAGLKGEMQRCAAYGIGFVVSHIGACVGQDEPLAMTRAAEATLEVLAETPEDVMLLAETTAGQGSSLNVSFEQMARFFELAGAPERLGICLDTCHIFAAGYDIRTVETFSKTFESFDRMLGFERLKAVHANDSKMPFGSRRDRHAHIGEGEIGMEAFRILVNDARFEQIPILIETPEAETEHARNVGTLLKLRQ